MLKIVSLASFILLNFIVGGIGLLLENKLGDINTQREFYAITAALFIMFAYLGFVYRYLLRRRGV